MIIEKRKNLKSIGKTITWNIKLKIKIT
jgi:hypothetical protein